MNHKHRKKWLYRLGGPGLLALGAVLMATQAPARDTDVFQLTPKSNAYISVDNSGSMFFTVYEHTTDWAALYDDFMTRNDLTIKEVRALFPDKKKNLEQYLTATSKGVYISDNSNNKESGERGRDLIANGPDDEHGLHYERNRVYLVEVEEGVNVVDGVSIVGDFGRGPEWRVKQWNKQLAMKTGKWEDALYAMDMKATIDENGDLQFETGSPLSKNSEGHILLNGEILPLGQDLPEHEYTPLRNGRQLDSGFVGYLQAPGFVNSGYGNAPIEHLPFTGTYAGNFALTGEGYELWKKVRCQELIECDANYAPKQRNGNYIPKLATKEAYQAWADLRLRFNGLNWRDWKGGAWWGQTTQGDAKWQRIVSDDDAFNWTPTDWANFIAYLDYERRQSWWQGVLVYRDKDAPNDGKHEIGPTLLGRWAHNFYTNNRGNSKGVTEDVQPEKGLWEQMAVGTWEKSTNGSNRVYMFVTGNYLNFCQALSLRYIESPSLKGKTLAYPYPEKHSLANAEKHGGTEYSMYYDGIQDYLPSPNPKFDLYDENMKRKSGWGNYDGASNPLFYEGWKPKKEDGTNDPDYRRGYRLQSRVDALREALTYVIDNFGNKMNWGFAKFYQNQLLVPNPLDLTKNPAARNREIRTNIRGMLASSGTPLASQLQNVWYRGFYLPYTREQLGREEDCGKYFLISLTDGMANGSNDTNHSRQGACLSSQYGGSGGCSANSPTIPTNVPLHPNYNGRTAPSYAKDFSSCSVEALGSVGKNAGSWASLQGFQNWDCDNWRNDPSLGNANTASLYDDISEYMYTHSFKDSDEKGTDGEPLYKAGDEICNPRDPDSSAASLCRQTLKESQDNVKSHHIAFGLRVDMMRDAAESAGGKYFVASNKEQLVAVFEDLAQDMLDATTFVAPTPSTNSENKMESGSDMYMGLFHPLETGPWVGNVKKYQNARCGAGGTRTICDKHMNVAIDKDGNILESAVDLWDTGDPDLGGDTPITTDGVGEVLLKKVKELYGDGKYWDRPIYTAVRTDIPRDDYEERDAESGEWRRVWERNNKAVDDKPAQWRLTPFKQGDISAEMLDVAGESARNALVNYVHGYTRAANTDGTPRGVRDWIMGPVIHAQPIVLDYYDTTQTHLPPKHRFVAVGSGSGMLHVFRDCGLKREWCQNPEEKDGEEVFSFIPPEMLRKLKDTDQAGMPPDMVDGPIVVFRGSRTDEPTKVNTNPKYLIFGERRGGWRYWCLDVSDGADPSKWTVKWSYRHKDLGQSWSELNAIRVLTGVDPDSGVREYQDALVFSGGYDPIEDNYPEPFENGDGKGSVVQGEGPLEFNDDGTVKNYDPTRWNTGEEHDLNGNGKYDLYNDATYDKDKKPKEAGYKPQGRSLFVVHVDNPYGEFKAEISKDGKSAPVLRQLLPLTVTYGSTMKDGSADGRFELPDMKYSFPASPSVVTRVDEYSERVTDPSTGRTVVKGYRMPIVMNTFYAADIYADIFRVLFDVNAVNKATESQYPDWVLTGEGWKVAKIFGSNPGCEYAKPGSQDPGTCTPAPGDQGRKTFHSPTVSWGGTTDYFMSRNFRTVGDTTFAGRDGMMTLVFGTGDREHPNYTMVSNRLYAVYDDSTLRAEKRNANGDVVGDPEPVGKPTFTDMDKSESYTEADLMNLTCDELGLASRHTECYLSGSGVDCGASAMSKDVAMKRRLRSLLLDDPLKRGTGDLEGGPTGEDDFKGWFIMLDRQGGPDCKDHMDYKTLRAPALAKEDVAKAFEKRSNHKGEAVLTKPLMFYGVLYGTTYQPVLGTEDPCSTCGNGFFYGIDYDTAGASYNRVNTGATDIFDRYSHWPCISGLPSAPSITISGGVVYARAAMGGKIVGGGYTPGMFATNDQFRSNQPTDEKDYVSAVDAGAGDLMKQKPGADGGSQASPGDVAKGPGSGVQLYYWRDSNSQRQPIESESGSE